MTTGVGILVWGKVNEMFAYGLTKFEEPRMVQQSWPPQVENLDLELRREAVYRDENLGVVADTFGAPNPYLWRFIFVGLSGLNSSRLSVLLLAGTCFLCMQAM